MTLKQLIEFILQIHLDLAEKHKDMEKDPYWKGRYDGYREMTARIREAMEEHK